MQHDIRLLVLTDLMTLVHREDNFFFCTTKYVYAEWQKVNSMTQSSDVNSEVAKPSVVVLLMCLLLNILLCFCQYALFKMEETSAIQK